jgi:hypothetical protein
VSDLSAEVLIRSEDSLVFTLSPGASRTNWRVVLEMSIPPDDSLDRLASDIGELFGDL